MRVQLVLTSRVDASEIYSIGNNKLEFQKVRLKVMRGYTQSKIAGEGRISNLFEKRDFNLRVELFTSLDISY